MTDTIRRRNPLQGASVQILQLALQDICTQIAVIERDNAELLSRYNCNPSKIAEPEFYAHRRKMYADHEVLRRHGSLCGRRWRTRKELESRDIPTKTESFVGLVATEPILAGMPVAVAPVNPVAVELAAIDKLIAAVDAEMAPLVARRASLAEARRAVLDRWQGIIDEARKAK